MKVLIVYPNLPLMHAPAVSVGLLTDVCKKEDVQVDFFETTAYTDDPVAGMLMKTKLGNGRPYSAGDVAMDLKPTYQMLDDFRAKVEDYSPDLMLFSTVEDTFKDTIIMLDSVSDLNIDHLVGGVFPINAPDICINHPSINAIARFEGEYVLRDILRKMKASQPWDDVLGVWTKEKRNAAQPLVDLDEYYPDYSLYDAKRFLRPVGHRIVRSMNLESYRGCPYSCTFCNSPMTRYMDKGFLRRKSVPALRKEIDLYIEKYDPEYFFFVDDSWVARPRKEVIALCELMQEYKIPWWCQTRIENVDREILELMRQSYCDRISFGIECGDEQYRRDVLKRNVSNELYESKMPIINECGIPYSLNVIIGMPHETADSIYSTIDMIKKFGGYDSIAVSIFVPYHGTELRSYAVEKGLMRDPDWISSDGYVMGESPLIQEPPFLQQQEIKDFARKFKYYALFDKDMWHIADTDLDEAEKIFNETFYMPTAADGLTNITNRNKTIWGCQSDDHMDLRPRVIAVSH